MKDLIRYLRHEDETRDVRQQLGAAQILQSDLLPILTQHRQDKPLFDAVIRFTPQPFDSYLGRRPSCQGNLTTLSSLSPQADGKFDTASLALFWQRA